MISKSHRHDITNLLDMSQQVVNENINIIESVNIFLDNKTTVNENINIIESVNIFLDNKTTVNENINIIEQVDLNLTIFQTINETINIIEDVNNLAKDNLLRLRSTITLKRKTATIDTKATEQVA